MNQVFQFASLHLSSNQLAFFHCIQRSISAFIRDNFSLQNSICSHYTVENHLFLSFKANKYYFLIIPVYASLNVYQVPQIKYHPRRSTVHFTKTEGHTTYIIFSIQENLYTYGWEHFIQQLVITILQLQSQISP